MIGRRFNKLVVLSLDHVEDYVSPKGVKARVQFFNCECDCGNQKVIRQPKLYTTKSCGCLIGMHSRAQREDLTGHTYGRLTVISLDEPTGKWVCSCECGGTAYSKKSSLQSGGTKSCGCLQREAVSLTRISQLKEIRRNKGLPEETEDSLERSKFKPLALNILKRDKYTCAWCSQTGKQLNVHHIEPWATNVNSRFIENNLVTLCVPCHKEIHKGGNHKVDPVMTILLRGYATLVEDGFFFEDLGFCARIELTPN
jgi:5-methylcytosine-specific restriction endonuclease McrA